MTSLIEFGIIWIGNGIVTAFLIIINDLLFKKQVEKVVNKAIETAKKAIHNGK